MKGYMYILRCSDGSYYVGSTTNIERRLAQHQAGEGANHTRKRLPVELEYYEEYSGIDVAFYREKQIQRWRREKKEALINGKYDKLPELAMRYGKKLPSTGSGNTPSTGSGNTPSTGSGNTPSTGSDSAPSTGLPSTSSGALDELTD